MPLASSSIANAANILTTRRRSGEQGPLLPEACRPSDIDSALAIQEAVTKQMGERIGGWKCGLSADNPVIMAAIHASTVHTSSPCPAWTPDAQVRVEPELAFILGRDLPARETPYLAAEVDAAIARTHLALELIDSRYAEPASARTIDHLADSLLNQGLFIGPQVDDEQARATGTMPLQITLETGEDIHLDGRHPNTHPRAPLYWLAEFLRSRGQGLQAGQAVITGSYAGSLLVPAGQKVNIRYGDLGVLTVSFASKR